jgi:hypothetical protein
MNVKKEKKGRAKLLISFSGGESSAYMTQWLLKNKLNEFDIKVVFANTGEENENTIEFTQKCDEYFGFNCIWVECVTDPKNGNGVRAKVVDFETASRNGEPFEAMINKHGIPNSSTPHCTRELKVRTISAYMRQIGWTDYYTAIGIRIDEPHRINKNWKKLKHIYPLISNKFCPMRKPQINQFWKDMPFRIDLKGYEDNCKVCWKKSLRKLMTIAKNYPERFEKFSEWESKYENYIPESRKQNDKITTPIRFFRDNLSVAEIFKLSKQDFEEAPDDRRIYAEYVQTELFGHMLDVGGGPCGEENCEISES